MEFMTKFMIIYLLIINLAGFLMMAVDKRKAKKDRWRIPEKNFFIVALLGGSLGCYLGMQVFHHKTLHKTFAFGMPAILVMQILITLVLLGKGLI